MSEMEARGLLSDAAAARRNAGSGSRAASMHGEVAAIIEHILAGRSAVLDHRVCAGQVAAALVARKSDIEAGAALPLERETLMTPEAFAQPG